MIVVPSDLKVITGNRKLKFLYINIDSESDDTFISSMPWGKYWSGSKQDRLNNNSDNDCYVTCKVSCKPL